MENLTLHPYALVQVLLSYLEGCLPINYQSMLTDSPNCNPKIRDSLVLNLPYLGTYNYKDNVTHVPPPATLPLCGIVRRS